jgi:hypothetical protein
MLLRFHQTRTRRRRNQRYLQSRTTTAPIEDDHVNDAGIVLGLNISCVRGIARWTFQQVANMVSNAAISALSAVSDHFNFTFIQVVA